MTLLELVVVLAVIGFVMTMAISTMDDWAADQRAATSARNVSDAFNLARSEALRTGSNVILAFRVETGLSGVTSDVVVANDGPSATANCRIASTEIVHTVSLERGVRFGSDPGVANGALAPDDSGTSGRQLVGSSFKDGAAGNASWVAFGADGMPRRFTENSNAGVPCTAITGVGVGGGAIYVTNGKRDYAAVLTPLGTVRLHRWVAGGGGWTQ
jgi:type II secretory pathway pseudopilin PulG